MKKYQVLKWTAEVREKELQRLEEVELLDNHDPAVEFESDYRVGASTLLGEAM